jgi:hypothetical protein
MSHPEAMPDPEFINRPITEAEIAKQTQQIDYVECLSRQDLAELALKAIPSEQMQWLADMLTREYVADQDEAERDE